MIHVHCSVLTFPLNLVICTKYLAYGLRTAGTRPLWPNRDLTILQLGLSLLLCVDLRVYVLLVLRSELVSKKQTNKQMHK